MFCSLCRAAAPADAVLVVAVDAGGGPVGVEVVEAIVYEAVAVVVEPIAELRDVGGDEGVFVVAVARAWREAVVVLVEAFVGDGRGVVTTPVLAPGKDPTKAGCFLSAGAGSVTVNSFGAYEMGCGWAQYP